MRLGKVISLILIVLGAVFFVVAATFQSEDWGSCPATGSCTHYFPGTTIYIRPVVDLLETLGILSFGAGGIVFAISWKYRNKPPLASAK